MGETPRIILPILVGALPATALSDAIVLERGSIEQASLSRNGSVTVELRVAAPGAHVLNVAQRGIDVVVELRDPDARSLGFVDAPGEQSAAERFLFEPASPGAWTAIIHPRSTGAAEGRIGLELAALDAGDAQRLDVLRALTAIGQLAHSDTAEATQSAITRCEEVLPLAEALEDRDLEATIHYFAARLIARAGKPRDSIAHYERALALWSALGDAEMEGAAENGLGLAHAMLSEFEPALGHMRRAAELQSALPWAYDAAESRANVCWITQEEGRLEAARDCFDETLPEIRNLGSLDLLATVQNNLAGVSAGLGDPDSALAWLHATLPLRERIGQPKGIGEVHNNLAFVYRRVGEIQRALDEYIAAIPWRRAANDTRGLGVTYNNVGFLFQVIGDPARAKAWLEPALSFSRDAQDRVNEARIELNLGNAARSLGIADESLAHYRKALELSRALSDRVGVCRALTLLAQDQRERGAVTDAAATIREGTDCNSIPDLRARAWFLLESGRQLALVEPAGGRAQLDSVLALFTQQRDPVGSAAVHDALSDVAARAGDIRLALKEAHAAIDALESLRVSIAATDQLAHFTAVQQSSYDRAIALHLRRYAEKPDSDDDLRAFELVAATRARTLAERLESPESRVDGAENDPQRDRYSEQRRRTSDLANTYYGHLEKGRAKEAEDAAVQYQLARAQLDSMERKLFGVRSARREADALPALQASLSRGALLLAYWLGNDASRVWAVTHDAVESHSLPARGEIESLARRVYGALGRSEPASPDDAANRDRLSGMLLASVTRLDEFPDLYVSADGVLNYLPFAALASPTATADARSALVDTHGIVSLPALAKPGAQQESAVRPARGIAVFADPVYAPTDDRFAPGVTATPTAVETPESSFPWLEPEKLPRLRWSRDEVRAIRDDTAPGQTQVYANFDATRERLLALDGDFGILHVVAHVHVDSASNATSGVVLSLYDAEGHAQPGFVSYYDLLGIRRSPPLVVLSGCDTGLGVDLHGEGPVGLARAFMYSGAMQVVASLWPTGDQSSARLMAGFYRGLLDPERKLSPAAALRQAQLDLRNSDRRFRHPYSWAAFTVSYRAPTELTDHTTYARAATPGSQRDR